MIETDLKMVEIQKPMQVKDLWQLMKPELTTLSVFTSIASAYLTMETSKEVSINTFILLAIGTMLVGGGCGALNQYIEWELDGEMKRTEKRPIPSKRIAPQNALVYGIVISIVGCGALFLINYYAGFLSIATIASYLFLYTPLKRISTVSTIIGAFPGAIPVLIGCVSIENKISLNGLILFAVLFYWQMPHFYSLAWMYRNDYGKAGFRLLTIVDSSGIRVAKYVVVNLFILLLVSVSPLFIGTFNLLILILIIGLGLFFIMRGIVFALNIQREHSQKYARQLFFASLIYLPLYFSLLVTSKLLK
jgi:heme o synthase